MSVWPTILTRSGRYFDFTNPDASVVSIEDIAGALSKICRFTGHVRHFYSVAEHSVWVSRIVPPKDALAGLLHDAAEAFVGDVSKPLKGLLPDYAVIERRVEASVLGRFGLAASMPASVKQADVEMLAAEQLQAMHNSDAWWVLKGVAPAEVTLQFWDPQVAEDRFLRRFFQLSGGPSTAAVE